MKQGKQKEYQEPHILNGRLWKEQFKPQPRSSERTWQSNAPEWNQEQMKEHERVIHNKARSEQLIVGEDEMNDPSNVLVKKTWRRFKINIQDAFELKLV